MMEFKLFWAWVMLFSATISILLTTALLAGHILLKGVTGLVFWLELSILLDFFGFVVIADYISIKRTKVAGIYVN